MNDTFQIWIVYSFRDGLIFGTSEFLFLHMIHLELIHLIHLSTNCFWSNKFIPSRSPIDYQSEHWLGRRIPRGWRSPRLNFGIPRQHPTPATHTNAATSTLNQHIDWVVEFHVDDDRHATTSTSHANNTHQQPTPTPTPTAAHRQPTPTAHTSTSHYQPTQPPHKQPGNQETLRIHTNN